MKILICDDDIEIINEIEGLLSEHGGDFEITKAYTVTDSRLAPVTRAYFFSYVNSNSLVCL